MTSCSLHPEDNCITSDGPRLYIYKVYVIFPQNALLLQSVILTNSEDVRKYYGGRMRALEFLNASPRNKGYDYPGVNWRRRDSCLWTCTWLCEMNCITSGGLRLYIYEGCLSEQPTVIDLFKVNSLRSKTLVKLPPVSVSKLIALQNANLGELSAVKGRELGAAVLNEHKNNAICSKPRLCGWQGAFLRKKIRSHESTSDSLPKSDGLAVDHLLMSGFWMLDSLVTRIFQPQWMSSFSGV